MEKLSGNGKKYRIGLLGGTFDPVHFGHIHVAEAVLDGLSLNEIKFMPAGKPWMKSASNVTPPEHRLAMLQLAIRKNPAFSVSTIEIDRPGPTYTVDTLHQLQQTANTGEQHYLIMSWSTLAELPEWKEPSAIVEMCNIVVLPRPGYNKPDPAVLEQQIPGIKSKLIWLNTPWMKISSTAIRERVARGLSIADAVPAEVAVYIENNRLYKNAK